MVNTYPFSRRDMQTARRDMQIAILFHKPSIINFSKNKAAKCMRRMKNLLHRLVELSKKAVRVFGFYGEFST
jgi:hypothetical protein